jgi:NAD(P)-dependent dehydrogenase (short-subunit alcohol dehydrogenase family)
MKTIFITGASSGLGKATAKLFASNGWKVIATMRSPEKETELNAVKNITLLPLDVTNPEQIKKTVQKAISLSDIDIVFNNAGYRLMGPLESATDEQIVRQLNTNLLQEGVPTVQYVAQQLQVSPRYLSDMLRSLLSQNAQQYIQHKVIEKAKEMLSITRLSVAEIAYQLGFEHPQSFNNLFKRKTNLSPLEFRQSFN